MLGHNPAKAGDIGEAIAIFVAGIFTGSVINGVVYLSPTVDSIFPAVETLDILNHWRL